MTPGTNYHVTPGGTFSPGPGPMPGPTTSGASSILAGLSGAVPIIGPILSGIFGSRAEKKRNEMQMALAQKQMDFQERMSSTAHQRAAADLEKAGLNRILALGKPATTPGGAMANLEVPRAAKEAALAASATALQIRRQNAEIENINAATMKTKAETANLPHAQKKIIADTDLAQINKAVQQRNLDKLTAEIQKLGVDTAHATLIYELFRDNPALLTAQYSRPILDWFKSFGAGAATVAGLMALKKLPLPAKVKSSIIQKIRKLRGLKP